VPDAWRQWMAAAGAPDVRGADDRSFDNAQLVLDATAAGQGVALSTEVLAHRYLAEGRLVRPFDISAASNSSYHFVCRPSDLERPALCGLRDWLVAAMRSFTGA